MTMTVPYASATSDMRAREEIKKVLLRFGCESIGFMDDEVKHEVLLAFTHRGRQIQLRASARDGHRCGSRKILGPIVIALSASITNREHYDKARSPLIQSSATGSKDRSRRSSVASCRSKLCFCPTC